MFLKLVELYLSLRNSGNKIGRDKIEVLSEMKKNWLQSAHVIVVRVIFNGTPNFSTFPEKVNYSRMHVIFILLLF